MVCKSSRELGDSLSTVRRTRLVAFSRILFLAFPPVLVPGVQTTDTPDILILDRRRFETARGWTKAGMRKWLQAQQALRSFARQRIRELQVLGWEQYQAHKLRLK